MDYIATWLHDCDFLHSGCRRSTNAFRRPGSLQLLDVQKQCLVQVQQPEKYLALSYVWGGVRSTLRCKKENLISLMQPGSLSPSNATLPKTVADAMILTRALGLDYLWVDSLCIIQDDEENKMKEIARMGSIYSSAYFTIIAADGDDADHGLRGLKRGSTARKSPQVFLEFAPSKKFLIERYLGRFASIPKKWFTRAWTFQEFVLSKRMLIFLNGSVMWKCQEHEMYEDLSRPRKSIHGQMPHYTIDSMPSMAQYARLVVDYNHRKLTYDSDGLAAFSGVLEAYSPLLFRGNFQGLPELFFDIVLLWQPRKPVRRRILEGTGQACFPSWSWVSWEGSLCLRIWEESVKYQQNSSSEQTDESSGSLIQIKPVTQWYKIESTTGYKHAINSDRPRNYAYSRIHAAKYTQMITCCQNLSQGQIDYPDPEECGPSTSYDLSGSTQRYEQLPISSEHRSVSVKHFAQCAVEQGTPPKTDDCRLLFCSTKRSFLTIGTKVILSCFHEAEDSPNFLSCVSVDLIDTHGNWAGILRLNTSDQPIEQYGPIELITISEGKAQARSFRLREFFEEFDDDEIVEEIAFNAMGQEEYQKCHNSPENPGGRYIQSFIDSYEFNNVLWIEWHGGVAYRRALGRVVKPVWDSQILEEIEVILG